MNNFYGTQLGNHSRPFRIRHKTLRTAPPSRYSTLTLVSVCSLQENIIILETMHVADEISVNQF